MCICAKTCSDALEQATHHWPNRNRASDGCCSSSTHQQQNPYSDHDEGEAWDLTDDPAHGCDSRNELDGIRRRQVHGGKYGISDNQIFSSYPAYGYEAWEWRPYTGSNPHKAHGHLSIEHYARDFDIDWFQVAKPMTPADRKYIQALAAEQAKGRRHLRLRVPYMRGQDIKEVQVCLKIPYTRTYGVGTYRAVREFQKFFGLKVTGKVNNETWELILFINIAHLFGF